MLQGILTVILIIFCLYLFTIFFLSRIFVPNLGFKRSKIPEKIPISMEEEIETLKKKSKTKHEFLKNAYDFLTKKYRGQRVKTFTQIYLLWKPLNYIWRRNGFIQCNWQNYLLRIFLIKSRLFTKGDIKIIHTMLDLDIHQYLQIKTEKGWIDVCLWTHAFGVPFGKKPPFWV